MTKSKHDKAKNEEVKNEAKNEEQDEDPKDEESDKDLKNLKGLVASIRKGRAAIQVSQPVHDAITQWLDPVRFGVIGVKRRAELAGVINAVRLEADPLTNVTDDTTSVSPTIPHLYHRRYHICILISDPT